ncbi:Brix domain-containing protein [Dipodascopsis tothii]|uniref:Brix domain-containing protein n=1 Tax=Dipodascopsis tothii TaxID=44089 RepID=UPI0034CE3853
MLRTVKAKNARSKRAMDNRAPKLVENTKRALIIRGTTCGEMLHSAMADLSAFKQPDIVKFHKKNEIHPFEDTTSLEFFSEKNDTSLIMFGSNSKKRPQTLTWIRTFNFQILDMLETRLKNFKPISDFKKMTFNVGMKPLFAFIGPSFDSHPYYRQLKSQLLDFFRGEQVSMLDLAGLQHIIVVSADGDAPDETTTSSGTTGLLPDVHFRVYKIKTYKSATQTKVPRVEVDEIGPRFDFTIGRVRVADPEVLKQAMKRPKELEPKVKKNIQTDVMGDKVGTIHVGKQDLGKLQTRKMKGLKKRRHQDGDEEEEDEDDVVSSDDEAAPAKKIKA